MDSHNNMDWTFSPSRRSELYEFS